MDNYGKLGLVDLVNPLSLSLTDLFNTPAKGKRKKRRERQALSSDSSAEKPPKKESRMATKAPGIVSAAVNLLETPKADTNNVQMEDIEQQRTTEHENAGNHQVLAGNQGENIIREFSKMNVVRKEICDNKEDKADYFNEQLLPDQSESSCNWTNRKFVVVY